MKNGASYSVQLAQLSTAKEFWTKGPSCLPVPSLGQWNSLQKPSYHLFGKVDKSHSSLHLPYPLASHCTPLPGKKRTESWNTGHEQQKLFPPTVRQSWVALWGTSDFDSGKAGSRPWFNRVTSCLDLAGVGALGTDAKEGDTCQAFFDVHQLVWSLEPWELSFLLRDCGAKFSSSTFRFPSWNSDLRTWNSRQARRKGQIWEMRKGGRRGVWENRSFTEACFLLIGKWKLKQLYGKRIIFYFLIFSGVLFYLNYSIISWTGPFLLSIRT